MTPNSLPTFAKVSSTRSSCGRVCVAISEVRMRQAFGGTAGATTQFAKTPLSNRPRQKRNVLVASPMRIGMIGVSLVPVS